MEMYRTLAPCTVDGEDLSWCLADGLARSQLTLNTLWCWECTYPMLTGLFWWNKDKPSPQNRSWVLQPPQHSQLDLRGWCSHCEHIPRHHPVCVITFPSSWQEGLLLSCCKLNHRGCASYLSSQLVCLKEQELYPNPHVPHCTKLGVLYLVHPCREWSRYSQWPLAGQKRSCCRH